MQVNIPEIEQISKEVMEMKQMLSILVNRTFSSQNENPRLRASQFMTANRIGREKFNKFIEEGKIEVEDLGQRSKWYWWKGR